MNRCSFCNTQMNFTISTSNIHVLPLGSYLHRFFPFLFILHVTASQKSFSCLATCLYLQVINRRDFTFSSLNRDSSPVTCAF